MLNKLKEKISNKSLLGKVLKEPKFGYVNVSKINLPYIFKNGQHKNRTYTLFQNEIFLIGFGLVILDCALSAIKLLFKDYNVAYHERAMTVAVFTDCL